MKMFKTQLFPYIEGSQLVGKGDVVLTMRRVEVEMMPDHRGQDQEKYVLYFQESPKGLVLNKTNTKAVIDVVSQVKPDIDDPDETEHWSGVKVALYTEKVKAFGEVHDAVRVRDKPPAQKKAQTAEEKAEKAAEMEAVNDDLFGGDGNGSNHYEMEEA